MDHSTLLKAFEDVTSTVLLASTTPTASATLHETLKAGQAVRRYAAVHFHGPAPVFDDIRSVPAAVPPLPNAGGVRGGRPSYVAKQGGADFAFDYGLAFSLRPAGAFARGGFGSTCIERTCGGKGLVYARGCDPFIWERKRNRGGALICRGGQRNPVENESKAHSALSRRGVKRALEEGPSPRELGTVALLSELHRSKIPPIAVAPGLFLVPLLDARTGRLLDISATERGFVTVPRLVKVDHTGSFQCLCSQKACRDTTCRFWRRRVLWAAGGREGRPSSAFDGSRSFAREVTHGVPWVLPLEQGGCVGGVLYGLDAFAWKRGPHLRVIVASNPGEEPVVCVLGGEVAHCSSINCTGPERCRHLLSVLSEQNLPLIER
ncbi:hypothetical protein KFL_002740160 [Klebsormidium nitens]|uniref:SWIM-type domain-containing protein n=1 Tax=Klebsormidium nitens TaxID=105231 RepID=A0A1Y1IBR9_KLENI|nr:hypothetical protein KFL_002740160 [Klebsormidium nitens]|eukprot:GAQ86177.1 hypothetical protein KFL_002740160 [Klebsormidium nitens]